MQVTRHFVQQCFHLAVVIFYLDLYQMSHFVTGFTVHVVGDQFFQGEPVTFIVTFEDAYKNQNFNIRISLPQGLVETRCFLSQQARRDYHEGLKIERKNANEIYYISFTYYPPEDDTIYLVEASHPGTLSKVEINVIPTPFESCVFDSDRTSLYLNNSKQPKVKQHMTETVETPSARMHGTVKVETSAPCDGNFSSHFLIERLSDDYEANFCTMPDLIGQVDMNLYSSHWLALPADVELNGHRLHFQTSQLPSGLLRFTSRWVYNLDPSHYVDIFALIVVVPDEKINTVIRFPKTSGAERLHWPETRTFVVDISQSLLLFTMPGSGYIESPVTRLSYHWHCYASHLCHYFSNDKVTIPGTVKKGALIFLGFDMQFWSVEKFDKKKINQHSGPTRYRRVTFASNPLVIYIRTVRNYIGYGLFYGSSPLILKAECLDCKFLNDSDTEVSYAWGINRNVDARNTQYLIVLPSEQTSILQVKLTVTANGTSTFARGDYDGQAFLHLIPTVSMSGLTQLKPKAGLTTDVFSLVDLYFPAVDTKFVKDYPPVFKVLVNSKLGETTYVRSYSNLPESVMIKSNAGPVILTCTVYSHSNFEARYNEDKNITGRLEWLFMAPQTPAFTLQASITDKVRETLRISSYGFSAHYTMAQEIADGQYGHEDVLYAIKLIQLDMLNHTITHLKAELAINIMYLMYGAIKGQIDADDLIDGACVLFEKIQIARHKVDVEEDETTFMLSHAQITTMTQINLLLENSPVTEKDIPNGLCFLSRIRNLTIFYTRIHTCRGQQHITGSLFDAIIWWDKLPDTNLTLSPRNTYVYDVTIPMIELKKAMLEVTGPEGRDDFYLNIVVFTSTTNFLKKVPENDQYTYGKFDLNLGIVELYLETKAEGRELHLKNMSQPVDIVFQNADMKSEDPETHKTITLDVNEDEYGNVIDSTCYIFVLKPSADFVTLLRVSGPEEYNLNYSILVSPQPSGYLNFPEEPQSQAGSSFSTVIAPVTKYFVFTYKRSRTYVLIKVASKNSVEMNTTDQMFIEEKSVELAVRAETLDCAHFEIDVWRREKCKINMDLENDALICSCTVHAPYSGMIKPIPSTVEFLTPVEIVTHGPSYICITVVLAMWICFIAYFNVAAKLDKHERLSGRIHVIPNSYSGLCHEKFLVCLTTGVLPGSGTRGSIAFTLIGEDGATSHIQATRGLVCTPGSELWFVLGANLPLNGIEGVAVDIDIKNKHDAWHFKSMIVYSLENQLVYVFSIHHWLTQQHSVIYLPTLHVSATFLHSVMVRFWRFMRTRHTILSLFFPIPGCLSNRVERLLVALFVFSATMIASLIARNLPSFIFKGDDEEPFRLYVVGEKALPVSLLAVCFSLLLGQLISRFQQQRHRCFWPATPRPESFEAPELKDKPKAFNATEEGSCVTTDIKSSVASYETDQVSIANSNIIKKPFHWPTLSKVKLASTLSFATPSKMSHGTTSHISFNRKRSPFYHIVQQAKQQSVGLVSKSNFNQSASSFFHPNHIQHRFIRSFANPLFLSKKNFQPTMNRNNCSDVPENVSATPSVASELVLSSSDVRGVPSWGTSVDVEPIALDDSTRKQKQTAGAMVNLSAEDNYHVRYVKPRLVAHVLFITVMLICITNSYLTSVFGYFYSQPQSYEWTLITCLALLMDIFILEPVLFMVASVVAQLIGATPVVIAEVKKRAEALEEEKDKRIMLEYFNITSRATVPPIHKQVNKQSLVMLVLKHWLWRAYQMRSKELCLVHLKDGFVYLVLIIATTTIIMNMHSRIFASYTQAKYVEDIFQFGPNHVSPQKALAVENLWNFLKHSFVPTAEKLKPLKVRKETSGLVMVSSFRLRQVRVIPLKNICQRLHPKLYKPGCNFELDEMVVDNRHYREEWKSTWPSPELEVNDPYLFRNGTWADVYVSRHNVYPSGGYEAILIPNEKEAQPLLNQLQKSDWIDENTRAVFVDFTLFNTDIRIASTVVIAFLFTRAGIFQETNVHSLSLSLSTIEYYLVTCSVVVFFCLSCYSMFRELTLLYHNGIVPHLKRRRTYFELLKICLSFAVIGGIVLRSILIRLLLNQYIEISLKKDPTTNIGFANFLPLAHLVLFLNVTCGLLAFIVLFQMLSLFTRLIDRLAFLFIMLSSTLILLVQPVIFLMAFASTGHLLFASLDFDFSSLELSFLTVLQNAIYPTHITYEMRAFSPILGSLFVLGLLGGISFLCINFFKIFLNEAYSQIVCHFKTVTYGKERTGFMEFLHKMLEDS